MQQKQVFSVQKNLFLFIGIYMFVNLLQSYFTPLIDDEAYYWVWSQRLDWGYYDHPPMVALWIKIGFSIFQNELGVRLITVILNAFVFWFLSDIVQPKNKEQFLLFVCVMAGVVLFQVFGFITTPDAPLLFFSVVYLWVLKKFIRNASYSNALLLGLLMALVMYSKYHGALLILFSLIPLIPTYYKNPKAYLAIAIGVICYLPHIFWMVDNDFAPLNYHIVRRNVNSGFEFNHLTDYLASLLYAVSPLTFYFYYKAIFKYKTQNLFEKSLVWIFFGIIGFFIFITFRRSIQAQWSLAAFIPLAIITFLYFRNRLKSHKLFIRLTFIVWVLILIARVYFALPNVPIETKYHGWKQAMIEAGKHVDKYAMFHRYQYTSLFNFYNYPDKIAGNYVTIENRYSQYKLWNSEDEFNGKDITYFSKHIKSNDSIPISVQRDMYLKYWKIPNFQTTQHLQIDIQHFSIDKDSITMDLEISNHGATQLNISPENKFALKMIINNETFTHKIKCGASTQYTPFVISPNQKIYTQVKGKICLQKENLPRFLYLGFSYDNLPIKIQSNHIQFNY